MANDINNGTAITANATHSYTPPKSAPKCGTWVMCFKVTAGTATLDVNQRGVEFANLNNVSLTTAGSRVTLTGVSNLADVDFVVSAVSSFSGTLYFERLSSPTI